MPNYKNPYVKLECLPDSIIESFIRKHSSVKEQSEEKNKKPLNFAKTKEKNGKRTKFAKTVEREEKNKKGSRFANPDKGTGRLSRLVKQKGKSYCFKDLSKDGKSEADDSEKKANCSKISDNEDEPCLKREKKKGKQQEIAEVKELTEYEKLILKNKNDKMSFLMSLKINEVKEGFSEAVKGLKARKKRILKPKPPIVPRHKIARSSKVEFNLSEKALHKRNLYEAKEALKELQEKRIRPAKVHHTKVLPACLHFKDALHSEQSYELFVNDFKHLDKKYIEPINEHACSLNDMILLANHVKIFPTTLTALDIHPMREKTIIAGGDINGNIYLWNMTDPKPYTFELHSKDFSCLKFNAGYPHLIMCCNNDGFLRQGDLVSNVYNKVTSNEKCTYFDFLSPDTCLVADRNGYANVVDMRSSKKKRREILQKCHGSMLRSVSVNPLNKNEFITPTDDGCVRLWDLRKLQEHPIIEVCHSSSHCALYSAIYSPLTGKSVLTSSMDAKICRSDIASWGVKGQRMFKRKFRSIPFYPVSATWQPGTDNVFAMPNNFNLRSIDIYDRCNKMFNYSYKGNTSTVYFCTFHPSLPLLAVVQGKKVYTLADKKL